MEAMYDTLSGGSLRSCRSSSSTHSFVSPPPSTVSHRQLQVKGPAAKSGSLFGGGVNPCPQTDAQRIHTHTGKGERERERDPQP